MAETEQSIFPQYGFWPVDMSEAVMAARRAGYAPTKHATFQRGLWRAVKITQIGDGVHIRHAWTTAQIMTLGVFFTLLVIFMCGGR